MKREKPLAQYLYQWNDYKTFKGKGQQPFIPDPGLFQSNVKQECSLQKTISGFQLEFV